MGGGSVRDAYWLRLTSAPLHAHLQGPSSGRRVRNTSSIRQFDGASRGGPTERQDSGKQPKYTSWIWHTTQRRCWWCLRKLHVVVLRGGGDPWHWCILCLRHQHGHQPWSIGPPAVEGTLPSACAMGSCMHYDSSQWSCSSNKRIVQLQ